MKFFLVKKKVALMITFVFKLKVFFCEIYDSTNFVHITQSYFGWGFRDKKESAALFFLMILHFSIIQEAFLS